MDFFHSEREVSYLVIDEIMGTWGQSFVFIPINFTTMAHMFLCMGTQNAFLETLWNAIFIANIRTDKIKHALIL